MKFFTLSALLALSLVLSAQSASYFINEISYTASNPSDKGFEIAGLAGNGLSGWTAVQYDADGWESTAQSLSNQIIPNQQNGYGTVWYDIDQGGDGGGIALVDANGTVQQFLAYGTLTAGGLLNGGLDGPATGLVPDYIGLVSDVNSAIQLVGSGNTYGAFMWVGTQTASLGQVNDNQLFVMNSASLPAEENSSPSALEAMVWPNPTSEILRVRLSEGTSDSARDLRLFDQQGRQLILRSINNDRQTVQLDVSNLPAGFYYLTVNSEDNSMQREVAIN